MGRRLFLSARPAILLRLVLALCFFALTARRRWVEDYVVAVYSSLAVALGAILFLAAGSVILLERRRDEYFARRLWRSWTKVDAIERRGGVLVGLRLSGREMLPVHLGSPLSAALFSRTVSACTGLPLLDAESSSRAVARTRRRTLVRPLVRSFVWVSAAIAVAGSFGVVRTELAMVGGLVVALVVVLGPMGVLEVAFNESTRTLLVDYPLFRRAIPVPGGVEVVSVAGRAVLLPRSCNDTSPGCGSSPEEKGRRE